jgi:hypothetical protein
LTVLGLVLPASSAVGAAVLLRPRTWAVFALAAYVLLLGEVVALVELLSLWSAVDAGHLLALELVVALAVAVGLAAQRARRRVTLPRRPALRQALAELGGRPLLALLLVGVGVAIFYELELALFTPPNNDDSLTYHLGRAATWYQRHRVDYFNAHTQRENGSAPNAEILILLTFVFTHGDRLAAAWQWLAQLATLAGIYVIGLRLRLTRGEALFAALLFATLPQAALQASTTQNDLVAASLVAAAVAFLATEERWRYQLAALALGLALGTKLTVAFALPGLALVAAVLVPRRDWLRLLGWVVAAFALVGAYGYVLNVVHTGAIQGTGAALAAWEQHSWSGRLETLLHIPARLLVYWAPTNQDLAYFGPLGALALVPVLVLTLVRAARARRPTLAAALALVLPLYVVALALAYKYNPWIGRYLLTPVALAAPLLGPIARHRAVAVLAVAVGLGTLGYGLVESNGKPSGLGAGRSIWTMPRSEAQSIERPPMSVFFHGIEACVPPHARLGYAIDESDWDYPLFGRDLTRVPVRLPRADPVAAATARGLQWLVVRNRYLPQPPPPPWQVTVLGITNFDLLTRGAPCRLAAAS